MTVPHLPHKTDLTTWPAVDRDGCFVKLSRSINFVPLEVVTRAVGLVGLPMDSVYTYYSLYIYRGRGGEKGRKGAR